MSLDVELDIIHIRLISQKYIISLGKVLVDKKDKKTSYEKVNANKLTYRNSKEIKTHQKACVNYSNKCVHISIKIIRIYKVMWNADV